MSRGPGRCQRAVLDLLGRQPERKATRAQLEEVLGIRSDNLLRTVRSLEAMHQVGLQDGADKRTSTVTLPRRAQVVSEGR
jgi:hypothetical protein